MTVLVIIRTLPWTKIKIPGVEVKFDSRVVLGSEPEAAMMGPHPDHPEFLYFLNTSSLTFCGTDVPCTSASVTVQFIGPGSVVRFLFNIPRVGQIVMFQVFHVVKLENWPHCSLMPVR